MRHLFYLIPQFIEATNMPPSKSDLNLVNFLLWSTLQQKLYCQEILDVDQLKCILLQQAKRQYKGARTTATMGDNNVSTP